MKTIQVEKGKFRAVDVTYNKRGVSTVVPLTGWGTFAQAQALAPHVRIPTFGK